LIRRPTRVGAAPKPTCTSSGTADIACFPEERTKRSSRFADNEKTWKPSRLPPSAKKNATAERAPIVVPRRPPSMSTAEKVTDAIEP
jgi:hypothetical protein